MTCGLNSQLSKFLFHILPTPNRERGSSPWDAFSSNLQSAYPDTWTHHYKMIRPRCCSWNVFASRPSTFASVTMTWLWHTSLHWESRLVWTIWLHGAPCTLPAFLNSSPSCLPTSDVGKDQILHLRNQSQNTICQRTQVMDNPLAFTFFVFGD